MSHFYGRMLGSGKEVTRQGTKGSGISAELSMLGAKVRIDLMVQGGVDTVLIRTQVLDRELVIFVGPIEHMADELKVYGRIAKQLIKA